MPLFIEVPVPIQGSERSCICVLGHVFVCQVMYLCIRLCICVLGHVFVYQVMYLCARSCICVIGHVFVYQVMYLCIRSCICVLGHVFVYQGIDFTSFYDLSVEIWNCSDIVIVIIFYFISTSCRIGVNEGKKWNAYLYAY